MNKRSVVSVAAALSVACACTATSEAKIVVNKGIAGVSVGDSKKSVKSRFGAPFRETCDGKPGNCKPLHWFYKKPKIDVAFYRGKVVHVGTTSKRQRTADGIGPGTSTKAVRARYPKCRRKEFFFCFLPSGGTKTPPEGHRYTFLQFNDTGVAYVVVGVVDSKHDGCALGCG